MSGAEVLVVYLQTEGDVSTIADEVRAAAAELAGVDANVDVEDVERSPVEALQSITLTLTAAGGAVGATTLLLGNVTVSLLARDSHNLVETAVFGREQPPDRECRVVVDEPAVSPRDPAAAGRVPTRQRCGRRGPRLLPRASDTQDPCWRTEAEYAEQANRSRRARLHYCALTS